MKIHSFVFGPSKSCVRVAAGYTQSLHLSWLQKITTTFQVKLTFWPDI